MQPLLNSFRNRTLAKLQVQGYDLMTLSLTSVGSESWGFKTQGSARSLDPHLWFWSSVLHSFWISVSWGVNSICWFTTCGVERRPVPHNLTGGGYLKPKVNTKNNVSVAQAFKPCAGWTGWTLWRNDVTFYKFIVASAMTHSLSTCKITAFKSI